MKLALWAADAPGRLPDAARTAVAARENDVLERLPDVHGDPFDRVLICQAIHEDCVLVTPDSQIGRYPVRVLW
jgi:PIN domain nuclease of toxin-antitoxin system